MFGLSIWELLIVLAIVLLVFGPKRLGTLGADLGNAIKGFRTAIKDESVSAQDAVDDQKVNADSVKNTADQKTNV